MVHTFHFRAALLTGPRKGRRKVLRVKKEGCIERFFRKRKVMKIYKYIYIYIV